MTELDHITVIAPELSAGTAWVCEVLGIEPSRGGAHPQMSTHNHLLRLGGDVFLEVIATDPKALRPGHHRWFGLDDRNSVASNWNAGRRLRCYVARCSGLAETIGGHAGIFGTPMEISRGDRRWTFAVCQDGELPMDGALPHLIDWGKRGTAAKDMQDYGLRLSVFVVETPEPDRMRTTLESIGMSRKPEIRSGDFTRLYAVIETPNGSRLLA